MDNTRTVRWLREQLKYLPDKFRVFMQIGKSRYPLGFTCLDTDDSLLVLEVANGLEGEIRNLAATNKILAVKFVRDSTGLGLKEALDLVNEALKNQ